MKNNMYAVCDILNTGKEVDSDKSFKALVECRGNNKGGSIIYIGNDMITNTPFIYCSTYHFHRKLSEAAEKGYIKKGRLIACDFDYLTKEEMIKRLQSMSEEDIKKYAEGIEKIKSNYSAALKDAKKNAKIKKNEKRELEKLQEETLKSEKGRIKNIVKRLIR